MIKNNLLIAWRNLVRNKTFSAINILGLAAGLACSLVIVLWVNDERSIDDFHANGKQLYQVYERNYYDGKVDANYATQGLLAQELKKAIPEVQLAASLDYTSAPGTMSTFQVNDKVNKQLGFYAGEDCFGMFTYPLLQGTTKALQAPNTIAISKKMASLFFKDAANAIGKTIRYENKQDLQVTAVFEDLPANSSMQFDFLRCWKDFVKDNQWVNNWGNTSPATYVLLSKDADAAKVNAKIKDFIYNYREKNNASRTELALQLYKDKYLHSTFKNGEIDGGRIEYVKLFTLVAIFILLIACINFTNLATARAANRSKEVGIKKVIGALKYALVKQFLTEAILVAFLSAIVAIAIVLLILPSFNIITGKQLIIPFSQPLFWAGLIALLLATGFMAGIYPAFFLSSLKPIRVLKGNVSFGKGAAYFRKSLVVFQFSLSIILIIGMIVIYKQVNFIQNRNIGYEKDNLVYLPIEGDLINKYDVFKTEAMQLPGIESISKMRNTPTIIEHHTGSIEWPGKDQNIELSFADGVVGYDFIKTMKLQLKAGRDFSKEYADSTSYIINETAAGRMGFAEPLGQTIRWGNRPGKIIGVLKDFHFSSMHQAIDPLIVRLDEHWSWGTILVRTKAGEAKQAIAGLDKLCKSINPNFPFTYQFSDLEFANLYKSEQVVSRLAGGFSLLAIFISCMGLFGLTIFVAAQRKKEIGVRKVLGAGVLSITTLLSKDFIKLVLISIVIATPVAWWAMNKWLQDFAYKTTISLWILALAAVAALLIAFVTVSIQTIKAALVNPVKSLRSE